MKSKLQITFASIRYASVVVVALATAFVAIDQRAPGIVPGHGMYDHYVYTFGWPMVAGTHQISEPMLSAPGMKRIEHWTISWSATAIDVLAYLTIVVCTFAVARYYLPLIRFGRVSLSLIFILMTTCASFALLMTWEFDPSRRLIALISTPLGTYFPITLYPCWISVPVLYGMACVSFVMINFLGTSMQRITMCCTQRSRAACQWKIVRRGWVNTDVTCL